ncbi:hypothetical protein [Streptomyces sp. t39]|uniref:hypothetical protein n=1 Tax=Streptomyces sp. t39 TaxID=1828156 RepID=UPI0011CD7CC4|nr:hypothetical protein [Streptomyces sp. t39]TXS55783.1 hypothetical protein EAO77_06160 [Streptomyces sp. t39]
MSSDQQYPNRPPSGYEPQEPYGTQDPYGAYGSHGQAQQAAAPGPYGPGQASPYPQPPQDGPGPEGYGHHPYPAGAAGPYADRSGGWAAADGAPYPAPGGDPYAAGAQAHDPYAGAYASGGDGAYAPSGDPSAQDAAHPQRYPGQGGAGAYPARAGGPHAPEAAGSYAPRTGDPYPPEAAGSYAPRAGGAYAPGGGAPSSGAGAAAYPQGYRDPAASQEPGAAQTWQGETWDTQYQPALAPTAASAAPSAGALPPETGTTAAAPAPATDGYGTPTTSGNSRITDAQRARAEGRSPIIPPGVQPAGLTAVLGLLLAGGAALGPYALLVPLVLLQAVTAAGWFRLNGMWPARQGIALAFAGGLAADAALLAAGEGHGPAAIIGSLGVWVLLALVLQLRSHAGADERLQGLMATIVSAALAILAAGCLAAAPDAVVVGGIAVAAATVARALPLPGAVSVVVALAAGAGAGIAAGGLTDLGTKGALLGLAAGGCALIGLRVASYDYPSRFVHMTAGVALPLTAAVPALYLVGRALV